MGAVLFDIEPLREALAGGRLILTANNRQRNQILRAYHTQQADSGQSQWSQPRLYTFNQWIDEQWQKLILEGGAGPACLISNWQSRLIWERAIEQSDAAEGLLRPRQLAPTAETARATLAGWQCPTAELESYRAFESEADANAIFADWLERFDSELAARDLVTRETAQAQLTTAFSTGQLATETGAVIYGFNQLSPLAETLLTTALPDARWLERVERQPEQVWRTSGEDAESELAGAAAWASRILERQSDAVVGIVVPELGQRREQVERIFCEVFEPRLPDPLQPRYTPAFNFSAGTPLGNAPIIACALELVDLHRAPLELERVCNLMASPFWGDWANERIVRSRICVQLRDMGKTHISGADLRYAAQRAADKLGDDASDLHRRLERAGELQRERHQKAPLSYWLDRLMALLDTLGWPGSRRLDSVEYQQLKQWYDLQAQIAAVDPVRGHFSLSEALQLLRQSAEQTHFQPQTPDSPIQILGALEAAGLHFTHLWVVGLHHRAWPSAPRPNPLLPIPLQRQWRMPHASPDRELAFAESLTSGFRHSAFEVVFSHPSGDADEPLKPSALIESIPYQPLSALTGERQSLAALHHREIAQSARLDKVPADRGPSLDAPAVRGGASLFKHQAACPFAAFARYRLGARSPDRPALGFSAIERGNALHGVLARLWQELRGSKGLAQCSAEALRERIEAYSREEITPLRQRRPRELGPAYTELEIERLTDLIERWLSFERERGPFEVDAVEKRYPITYAGLELNLQVDRMDRLPDGGLLVIDYKTGQADPRQWRSEALKEPQLPLYACAVAGEPTRAIAFGLVNAERQALAGWGTVEDTGLKTLADDEWAQQIEQWHQALTALADEFRAGWALAEYRFSDAERLDRDLHPLSRIAEQPRLQAWRDQSETTEPNS